MLRAGKGCLGALIACVLLAACDPAVGSETRDSRGHAREVREAKADRKHGARPARQPESQPHGPGRKHHRAAAVPQPTRNPVRRPTTYLVTRIVDGDTLELGNGETVRLVGIDTPEVGECGYDAASVALSRLVAGKQVRLGRSDEDRDRYGRLLRYVDVGSTDAGLRLIQNGLAIARYDSRDGYGFHPREPRYVAADRASTGIGCAKPVAAPQPLAGGGACAPGYSPCVPPYPPDADCADVAGPIRVSGSDPHGLDADGDGVACE
jgi:endonuclease YncB( thermonuclease family)